MLLRLLTHIMKLSRTGVNTADACVGERRSEKPRVLRLHLSGRLRLDGHSEYAIIPAVLLQQRWRKTMLRDFTCRKRLCWMIGARSPIVPHLQSGHEVLENVIIHHDHGWLEKRVHSAPTPSTSQHRHSLSIQLSWPLNSAANGP